MMSESAGTSLEGRADIDAVSAAATEWMVRVHDPDVSPESLIAWQSWMREDPAHAEAFRRMEGLDDLLRAVPRPPLPSRRETGRDAYDGSQPIGLWNGRSRGLAPRWALAASVLIAALALSLVATVVASRWSAGRSTMLIATRIGENRSVLLADGSTITLGGNSRVAVHFQPRERDIELQQGEAFFKVAHNRQRPFKVAAGTAVVVAVGTQFDVRREDNQVVVNVVEGRVVVLPRSPLIPSNVLSTFWPALVPVSVGAGEETTVDRAEVGSPSRAPDPEEAASWRSGRLTFRMQPLAQVLQQINRYSSKPIEIADPGIAEMKVTGTVVGGNVSGWVASLHSALGITALNKPDRIVLQRAQ